MNEDRYWYMDALRSILIVSVVVMHCANIYSVSVNWLVSDPNNSIAFNVLFDRSPLSEAALAVEPRSGGRTYFLIGP